MGKHHLHFHRMKALRPQTSTKKEPVDAEYLKEIEKARRELRFLIINRKCAPLMLQLAWHDAGTYDAKTRKGGPTGSIRIHEKLNHGANKELKKAVEYCGEVMAKLARVSYADLYQLAGVVAVEVTGGPKIDFVPGRRDSLESPPELYLPDDKQGPSHLREIFHGMGLGDKDIVALTGGLAWAKGEREGLSWTRDTSKFDNSYFVALLNADSTKLKLPTDKALLDDLLFREYVELYAKDEDAFFSYYAASHKKLSELGYDLKHIHSRLAHGVIGFVIGSTAVMLGYLLVMADA